MKLGSFQIKAEWGNIGVATGILAACLWYLYDIRTTSLNIQNLLLVQPLIFVVVFLWGLIVFLAIKIQRVPSEAPSEEREKFKFTWTMLRAPALMLLFALYVWQLPTLGFDVGTFAFIAACLLVQGDYNVIRVFTYSLLFSMIVAWGFKALMPFPVHTLVL